jgi:hypothetical protein
VGLTVGLGLGPYIEPSARIAWASSDPRVAAVFNGRVRGLAPGIARIQARIVDRAVDTTVYATVTVVPSRYAGQGNAQTPEQNPAAQKEQKPAPVPGDTGATGADLSWATSLLQEVRSGFEPIEIRPGDTTEIHKTAGRAVYAFADPASLQTTKPGGPILVQGSPSRTFNLEVHRTGEQLIQLVGFVSDAVANRARSVLGNTLVDLAVGPSATRRCVIAIQLDRFNNMTYKPGASGGPLLVGILMPGKMAPQVRCYDTATK